MFHIKWLLYIITTLLLATTVIALPDDFISYWPLTVDGNDYTGLNNLTKNGTVTNVNDSGLCPRDSCHYFSGTAFNNFVKSEPLGILEGPYDKTLCAWVKDAKGGAFSYAVAFGGLGNIDPWWTIAFDNTNSPIMLGGNNNAPQLQQVSLNSSNYVCFAWDNTTQTRIGYINGTNTVNDSTVVNTMNLTFHIGANPLGGEGMQGWISDVTYWNRTLTPQEVEDVWNNNGVPVDIPNVDGNLSIIWTNPTTNDNHTTNLFKEYSFNVSCNGGDCNGVQVWLDPLSVKQNNIINNITTKTIDTKWIQTKAEGSEKCFKLWTANAKDKKTELGWVLRDDLAECKGLSLSDKVLTDDSSNTILDDKNKQITLKWESNKCDGQDCYHISLTDAEMVNVDSSVKIGEHSAIAEYTEVEVVSIIRNNYNITTLLECDIAGEYQPLPSVFVTGNKFGANLSSLGENVSCRYVVNSSKSLVDFGGNRLGVYTGQNTVMHRGVELIDFTENVCSNPLGSADCVFNVTGNSAVVDFNAFYDDELGSVFIDPEVTLTNLSVGVFNQTDYVGNIQLINNNSESFYYPFEEGSGNTVNELGGDSAQGTITTFTWDNTNLSNKGVKGNGITGVITIAENFTKGINQNELVYAMWVNWTDDSDDGYLWRTPNGKTYMRIDGTGSVVCDIAMNGTASGFGPGSKKVNKDQLTHIACGFDGTSLRIYINGTSVSSYNRAGRIPTVDDDSINIGAYQLGSNAINGTIYDFFVDNGENAIDHMLKHYSEGVTRYTSGSFSSVVTNLTTDGSGVVEDTLNVTVSGTGNYSVQTRKLNFTTTGLSLWYGFESFTQNLDYVIDYSGHLVPKQIFGYYNMTIVDDGNNQKGIKFNLTQSLETNTKQEIFLDAPPSELNLTNFAANNTWVFYLTYYQTGKSQNLIKTSANNDGVWIDSDGDIEMTDDCRTYSGAGTKTTLQDGEPYMLFFGFYGNKSCFIGNVTTISQTGKGASTWNDQKVCIFDRCGETESSQEPFNASVIHELLLFNHPLNDSERMEVYTKLTGTSQWSEYSPECFNVSNGDNSGVCSVGLNNESYVQVKSNLYGNSTTTPTVSSVDYKWYNISLIIPDTGKGIITNVTGATPFYHNGSHVNITCGDMSQGEVCSVTFYVNATGALDTYEFFGIANSTNAGVNTSQTINITIVAAATGDTCTCAGLDNDWNVSMSDYCFIDNDCELGTGTLTFYNTGFFNVSANINTTQLGELTNEQTIYIYSDGILNIRG